VLTVFSDVYLSLEHIKGNYDSLTRQHKVIARFLLENPSAVLSMGIHEFAEKVGVSRATVFRFCKELGFGGYTDLQRSFSALRPVIQPPVRSPQLEWVTKSMYDAIYYTLHNLDPEAFQRAVDLMKNAKRLYWYGAGESGMMGEIGNHRCWHLGIDSYVFRETLDVTNFSMLRDQGAVFIFLSVSGEGPYLVKPLEMVKRENLTCIAITSSHFSPLTEAAAVVLRVASPRSKLRNSIIPIKAGFEAIVNALLYETAKERGIPLELTTEMF
jgi:RpiR family carbohydrate utilization transcriptional regulator